MTQNHVDIFLSNFQNDLLVGLFCGVAEQALSYELSI